MAVWPWLAAHRWQAILRRTRCGTVACDREAADARAEQPRPHQAGQPVNSVKLVAHLRAARVAAATDNSKAAEEHITAVATDLTRCTRMPDPYRPIDHEAAGAAVRPIDGVRTSLWLDRESFVAMVGGQRHRSMAMIDRVCVALEPLGDTLAVVVNVQDVAATNGDEAETLSGTVSCRRGRGRSCRRSGRWMWWRRRLESSSRRCRGSPPRMPVQKVNSDPVSAEGLVAVYDGLVVGYCATFRIAEEVALGRHSWREITGGGYASRHDPKGDWLYGMEVCVDPRHRGLRIYNQSKGTEVVTSQSKELITSVPFFCATSPPNGAAPPASGRRR